MTEPVIERWVNGKTKSIRYYDPNKTTRSLHREDGPALEKYDSYGNLFEQKYYFHGKLHREDGPAKNIDYGGGYMRNTHYLNGVYIDDPSYNDTVNRIQLIKQLNVVLLPHGLVTELNLKSVHNGKPNNAGSAFVVESDNCTIKKGKKAIATCKYEELETKIAELLK